MQVSIQTQKPQKKMKNNPTPPPPPQPQQTFPDPFLQISIADQQQKDKKIKKLTKINRQLIQKLKQQNQQLTKKISKQKIKPGRSLSVKASPKNSYEIQNTKRQLMLAYKQIDMYKGMLANLKAKQISIDSVDKINQLENKIKYQEVIIQDLQKQIKYMGSIREQQQKQLRIFQNQQVKGSVTEMQKQITTLKDKIKGLKKNSQKRDDIEKKQHAYQIQLQRALRKLNDQYYPGKQDKKQNNQQNGNQVSQQQWQDAKTQWQQLKKLHQQNSKKIDNLIRQKNKQLKSSQQNQLKIKQKQRKLNTLKNKLIQLTKLVTARQNLDKKAAQQQQNEDGTVFATQFQSPKHKGVNGNGDEKGQYGRQAKKWMIPQGYCVEKGKILPDSIFFSDKTLLKDSKKIKIFKINIWQNSQQIPCLIQFYYRNQKNQQIQGIQPVPNTASSLQLITFQMNQGDYLHKIKGYFLNHEIIGYQFISKFGKQITIKSQVAQSQGQVFSIQPRPNDIPSCIFGAYVRKINDDVRMCHIGVQFIPDW